MQEVLIIFVAAHANSNSFHKKSIAKSKHRFFHKEKGMKKPHIDKHVIMND